jgi:CRP-like cAMP-binding protein
VERLVGGAKVVLAELKSGDAFGEEALVSEAKRNASVLALGEGELLRLGRNDFNELLREPLLKRSAFEEAAERVRRGALWLDVRYPSEYQYDKRSTCRWRRCATCSPCSTARRNTSPIARAAGAARRRRSCSPSGVSRSGCSRGDCGAWKSSHKGLNFVVNQGT